MTLLHSYPVMRAAASYTVPDSVTDIEERAFQSAAKLENLRLGKNVKSIRYYGIYGASKLKTLVIENSDCDINDLMYTINNGSNDQRCYFNGTIYCANGSTAQKYADKYEYRSEPLENYFTVPTVTVANDLSGVKVSWNKIANATGYIVYRKEAKGSWTKIRTIANNSTLSIIDGQAKSGTTYYYTVKATSGTLQSNFKSSSAIKFLAVPSVKVTGDVSGVKVTWNKITGADSYIVYRKTPSNSWTKLTTITNGDTISYIDKTPTSGVAYYYTVKAVSGSTQSQFRSSAAINYLKAPTVKASNEASGINVTWDKTKGASGYIVYRKTSSGSWSRIKEISSGSTVSYVDTTAEGGTTYYYTVRATSGKTQSQFKSSSAIVRLTVPNVKAANDTTGVKVTWDKTKGASGYIVYRKTSSGSWARIKEISGGSTVVYIDKTAASGTTYNYTVRAVSGSSQSQFKSSSAIKYLKTPTVSVEKKSNGINSSWGKVTGASGYYVYRKTSSGSWTKIATVSSSTTSYLDKNAKTGTTYYYTVKAYNGSTTSAFKSSKSIKK